MKNLTIKSIFKVYQLEELPKEDQNLIALAKDACNNSYVPYSNFAVGAAVRLADGTIVTGTNQENAAYPSGLCAERTTLFYANSQYPNQAVDTLAVAAYNQGSYLQSPIPPCGACRQVILETENRYSQPIRILLYGEKEIYECEGISNLLPLSFTSKNME